jgi:hypothetical protein
MIGTPYSQHYPHCQMFPQRPVLLLKIRRPNAHLGMPKEKYIWPINEKLGLKQNVITDSNLTLITFTGLIPNQPEPK